MTISEGESPGGQIPDVQEQIEELEEELHLWQEAAARPETTGGPFGCILRVEPDSMEAVEGPIVLVFAAGYVGLTVEASDRYKFALIVEVKDARGECVASGFTSAMLTPGSSQAINLGLSHYRPSPGTYEVISFIRVRKIPLTPGDSDGVTVASGNTHRYTVK